METHLVVVMGHHESVWVITFGIMWSSDMDLDLSTKTYLTSVIYVRCEVYYNRSK